MFNDAIHKVVESQHIKPGKGPAFVRTKLKRLETGAVIDKTFRTSEKVEQAVLTEKVMEYIYKDGDHLCFMDKTTYEQTSVPTDDVEGYGILPENTEVTFVMHEESIVDVVLPDSVELTVTETDPGMKGDTAQGGSKPATMSTGTVVQVPLFVQKGETIMVNTNTGKYMGRK